MANNPTVYIKDRGYDRYALIAEKGHSIYEFRESSRQRAMEHAKIYCSSWLGLQVKWLEEKDVVQKETSD